MPEWKDKGIVLSAKKYGEKGLILNILTEKQGRHLGWFNNYKNKKLPNYLSKFLFSFLSTKVFLENSK